MLEEISSRRRSSGRPRQLEQRVAERTGQLQAANKELEASPTPCRTTCAPPAQHRGLSRALMEDARAASRDGQDSLRRIIGSTVRMGQLIDGLLNLSA